MESKLSAVGVCPETETGTYERGSALVSCLVLHYLDNSDYRRKASQRSNWDKFFRGRCARSLLHVNYCLVMRLTYDHAIPDDRLVSIRQHCCNQWMHTRFSRFVTLRLACMAKTRVTMHVGGRELAEEPQPGRAEAQVDPSRVLS
jgi:hypothetical protein